MIELYKYRRQVFMYIDQDCYTRVLLNENIEFGKLTAQCFKSLQSDDKYYGSQKLTSNDYLYLKFKDWFLYLEKNKHKFQIIWNISGEDRYDKHKQGELYKKDLNKPHEPWNLVCHHLGYYRRSGSRSYNDGFKLGVKGLNVEVFRKLKKHYDNN